jgi:hypothetical protein
MPNPIVAIRHRLRPGRLHLSARTWATVCAVLCVILAVPFIINAQGANPMPQQETSAEQGMVEFKYEYLTSAETLMVFPNQGDAISVVVLNDGVVEEYTYVVIYRDTGAGTRAMVDQGPQVVYPAAAWSLGYTALEAGEYWVRIQTTSQFMIPKVSFERYGDRAWCPLVSYTPGDFAVYQLRPLRKRMW